MKRKWRNQIRQKSLPSYVLGSTSKLSWIILLCSSLITAGITQAATLQPSYQEVTIEQGIAETYSKHFFPISTKIEQPQSSTANIVPTNITNVSAYQNPSLGLSLQYPSK